MMRKEKKYNVFGILKERIELNKNTKLVLSEKNEMSRYRDLAPTNNPEKITEYISALEWAFNNINIRNIAIAGPYGAGKSSIINAYISKHPELKCIRISLADFVQTVSEKEGLAGAFDEGELEKGFLKQIFYKVGYKKIPQSRYRKLHPIILKNIVLGVTVFFAAIFFGANFVCEGFNDQILILLNNATQNMHIESKTFSVIILLLIAGFFVWLLSKAIWFLLSRIRIWEDAT